MIAEYAAPDGAYHSFGFGFYNDAAPTALGFNIENDVQVRVLQRRGI
ncbi:MAG: hypothetical protein ABSG59_09935 [Verrucomicrobiota bacterium]|jgi:hypothetical protein